MTGGPRPLVAVPEISVSGSVGVTTVPVSESPLGLTRPMTIALRTVGWLNGALLADEPTAQSAEAPPRGGRATSRTVAARLGSYRQKALLAEVELMVSIMI